MSQSPYSRGYPRQAGEHRVVVLGASPKPARYSNKAIRLLVEEGYPVIPVHPKIDCIEGLPVIHELGIIRDRVHTLTLYVGPARSQGLIGDIVNLNPVRVIFNPGTESESLESTLRRHHIECIHGCTLVMLRTGQFI